KPGHSVALLEAPAGFPEILGPLPDGVAAADALGRAPHDIILLFVTKRADLERRFARTAKRLDPAGGLWVAWPKKAAGVATGVTEDVVRATALAAGLVDVKVCAIDETWSGLKCVVRLKDRPPKPKSPRKATS